MINETISLLGQRATDKVTGFAGVVTTVSFDLYGCVQVILTPATDDKGKQGDQHWFDVHRLDMAAGANGGGRVMPVPDFAGRAAVPADYSHGAAEKPLP